MMKVRVREIAEGISRYMLVQTDNEQTARVVAFRFVNKRREEDYNELAHNTMVFEIEEIPAIVNDVMLKMH